MPFDPFFSSANKKYYVVNPEYAALKAKVEAMSNEERDAWCERVGPGPATPLERQVLKSLRFLWHKKASCRRKFIAERYACDLTIAAEKHHCVVFHGHSSTGGKRGDLQGRGLKAVHHIQPPRRHLDHIYEKGKRPPKQ